jgi:two-component system sensor histidine kinase RegB
MREQISYCKRTLTSLTEHAGAARGIGIRRVAASVWLSALFSEWHKRRGNPSATLSGVAELDGKRSIDTKAMPEIAVDTALAHGLENLLDNAVRAGPPVRVNFEFTASEVLISVSDSGPGFATSILDRAGKQPLTAHIHGSGVGLLLTRAAVERLGGRLELANREDGGAVARVWIPTVRIAA